MTVSSYNNFMHGLGSGGHLAPVLVVLAALMILTLAMGRRGRGGRGRRA
jgi:hypothetical protein